MMVDSILGARRDEGGIMCGARRAKTLDRFSQIVVDPSPLNVDNGNLVNQTTVRHRGCLGSLKFISE